MGRLCVLELWLPMAAKHVLGLVCSQEIQSLSECVELAAVVKNYFQKKKKTVVNEGPAGYRDNPDSSPTIHVLISREKHLIVLIIHIIAL